jgi:TolB-like protein/Tfp pilus assembly protein PilF
MTSDHPDRTLVPAEKSSDDRLDSWKEIAAYLKRDVRTLHRWEDHEGLPVHRHLHKSRGSVYAYKAELDAWWNNRRAVLEQPAAAAEVSARPGRLRLISILVGIAFLLAGTLYLAGARIWPRHQPARRVMLAVLPFENLSGQPEEDYFNDGLTDELITKLGGLEPVQLGVIARTSAMQYKRSTKSAAQIGRELGVDYLLEGSARRADGRVRITAQLIQVRDETHVWAESYEGDLRDILKLQRDVAAAVAREIRLKLTPQQRAGLGPTRPVNPDAYEAYLKGLYFWNKFTVDGFDKSVEYFQQAIGIDPNYAPAYAGLAAAYALQGNFSVLTPQQAYPKSKAAAAKAIELDGSMSFAHGQLGFVTMFYDRDWAGAEREFIRALEINPSNANAHEGYAFYFVVRGQFEQALAEIQRARELDPLSLIINSDVGFVEVFARQYDQAIQQLQKTLEMDPNFPPTHWVLSIVYESKGLFKEANAEDLKAGALAQSDSHWVAEVQKAFDASGWKGSRRKRLELLLAARSKGESIPPYWLAKAYISLGERQKALDWLEQAVEVRFYLVVFLKVDPRFDGLRDDPRFNALLRRIGL